MGELAWTDAKPTVPGWYWWRDSHWTEPIRVIELDGRLGVPGVEVGDLDPLPEGQFAGPIPPPADAREGDEPR